MFVQFQVTDGAMGVALVNDGLINVCTLAQCVRAVTLLLQGPQHPDQLILLGVAELGAE